MHTAHCEEPASLRSQQAAATKQSLKKRLLRPSCFPFTSFRVAVGARNDERIKLPFFLSAASFHLGAGDIALLIQEIKVTFFSFDTALCYLFRASSFRLASCHLSARNISVFVNIIEVTLLPLYSDPLYFFCHLLFHPPSFKSLFLLAPKSAL